MHLPTRPRQPAVCAERRRGPCPALPVGCGLLSLHLLLAWALKTVNSQQSRRSRTERPSAHPEQGRGPPSPTTALGPAEQEPLALDGDQVPLRAWRRGVTQVGLP